MVGLQEQKLFMGDLFGFPNGSSRGSTLYSNKGEKITAILYTIINRHAGTPNQRRQKYTLNALEVGRRYFRYKNTIFLLL